MLVGAEAVHRQEFFEDREHLCKYKLLTMMRDKTACKHYDALPYK